MNTPPRLATLLNETGHEARHVKNIGFNRAKDLEIVEQAKMAHEIIVTHDLDYGKILALEGLNKPSVIIFRLDESDPSRLFQLIQEVVKKAKKEIEEGAIIIIEEQSIRVRLLPIKK